MYDDNKTSSPSVEIDLDTALKVAGGVAIVGGVVAVIVFGPAALGGALTAVGIKIGAEGAGMVKDSVMGP